MGCIVNGPGEMADADFGYVGGAPGKVNLYIGKTPVKFNIPETEAVDRLVDLIKENNKWFDAPVPSRRFESASPMPANQILRNSKLAPVDSILSAGQGKGRSEFLRKLRIASTPTLEKILVKL